MSESLSQMNGSAVKPSGGILSIKSVVALTSLSRTTIWREMRAGTFPMPLRLTQGRVGWSEAAVLSWIAKLIAGQADEAPPVAPDGTA